MPKILGIIGGGQLGMMLTEAATMMPQEISKVIVLDPTDDCPASIVGAEQIVADFRDRDAIVDLSRRADIITYEIESGDSDVLESVTSNAEINPSPDTLRIIQDKYNQKKFLQHNQIPVPEFTRIDTVDDLNAALRRFGYPAMLKARRDAYDGRGNYRIESADMISDACEHFKGRSMMLEKFVPFVMEVSVIAARSTRGEIKTYPLVENIHEESILRTTVAPARVSLETAAEAQRIAERTMDLLKGAGVFGIEMFVVGDGDVMINEIAPRVHNSGHHSLNSSETSQFEQHLRAILGMSLGGTRLLHNAVMYNILGMKDFEGRYKHPDIGAMAAASEDDTGAYLKMYGKKISKPLRKLGHLNLVDVGNKSVESLLQKLDAIKPAAVALPEAD